jgi:hypothetical protein
MVINRMNGRALILKGAAATLFDLCYEHGLDLSQIRRQAPLLFDRVAFVQEQSSAGVAVEA